MGEVLEDIIDVLLVDDHAVVRAGYRRLLESLGGIRVTAEADSGEAAYCSFLEQGCDVVVLDVSLPGMSGIETLSRMVRRDPGAQVLVFSMYEELIFARQALEAGALGYVTKRSAAEVLVAAVKAVAAGQRYLSDDVAGAATLQDQSVPLSDLAPREFEIFRLLAEGREAREIASLLSISYKTVANYATAIREKLGVSNAAGLARLAVREGVVAP